jgi:coenzyme PQQ synthesis protein D (PqqD)
MTNTNLSLHDALAVRPDVVFRQLNEEAVLLDLKSGTYFGLNDVGARMWQLIVERGALSSVLDALAAEYATGRDALERDLLGLGRELCDRGLAEVKR